MGLDSFFSEPYFCYILDSVLVIYCLIATAFFLKEKFSLPQPVNDGAPEGNGRIYQELERPHEADPYQVLEPSKRRKRAAKKKKPESSSAEERGRDPFESMVPQSSASPQPQE